MMFVLVLSIFVSLFLDARAFKSIDYDHPPALTYKQNPAPDRHRCGICPMYFQKICAFDRFSNSTYIFDNHCIMDLQNCIEGTQFVPIKYDHCLYFGNFAYVHGFKYEDMDYDEDHIKIKGSKKNPDFIQTEFVRRLAEMPENIFNFSD